MPPCSDHNSTDKGTYLVFGSLKLLEPKAHFTSREGILIHKLTYKYDIFEYLNLSNQLLLAGSVSNT